MKILVVDDDKKMLSILSDELKDKGYEVVTTDNSVEVFKIVAHDKIDLIISAVMMPCLSGFTLITMLKRFYFNNIPVILISSCNQEGIMLQNHGVTSDNFFLKPLDFERLHSRISEFKLSTAQA